MSQEQGMKKWLPDQVYHNEQHAREILKDLISKYTEPGNPLSGPYVLAVSLAGNQELIGHVGLSPYKNSVEIGYAIEEKFQGKGYATKAVDIISGWGFDKFRLSHIFGIVANDNSVSKRVLKSSRFQLSEEYEGILHNREGIIRIYIKLQ
jgi:ribosomal-protein-alanine N-acetyltransferase